MRGRLILMAIMCSGLPACATSHFEKEWDDCGVVEGSTCSSIADIQSSIVRPGGTSRAQFLGGRGPELKVSGVPMWNTDQIMQIHVSAFVDNTNNYHDDSVIYTVVRSSGWSEK